MLLHPKNLYVRQVLIVVALVLIGLGFGLLIKDEAVVDEATYATAASGFAVEPLSTALPQSIPTRLYIPDIGVDTTFVSLGLKNNYEIETPKTFDQVGWYVYGPTPGELGPSVILGHVDSYEGPAVFFSLGQLEPGDEIDVTREDGSVAVFEVEKLERYLQSNFPTSLVYGDIDYAGLRLITCSGSYDHQQLRYDHNLIVYAALVEVR